MKKELQTILSEENLKYDKIILTDTGSAFVLLSSAMRMHETMYAIEKNSNYICTYYTAKDMITVMNPTMYNRTYKVPAAYISYRNKRQAEEAKEAKNKAIQEQRKRQAE